MIFDEVEYSEEHDMTTKRKGDVIINIYKGKSLNRCQVLSKLLLSDWLAGYGDNEIEALKEFLDKFDSYVENLKSKKTEFQDVLKKLEEDEQHKIS